MANLLNKLVYVKKSASFTEELKETYKHSIVFVEDEGVLWTHGKSFGLSATDLQVLKNRVETLENTRWFNGIAEIGEGKSIFSAADGATVIKFGGDNIITVRVDGDGVHITAKEVSAQGDSYVTAEGSKDGSNKVSVSANITKMSEITGEKTGEGTLVDAADAKTYIDTEIGKVQTEIDGAVMDEGYVADVMVGGLNRGTDVSGKTAVEVLDLILKPEYAPVFTDATATISCTGHPANEVAEVGTKTPLENLYTSAGNKAYTIAGSHRANGGDATVSFSISGKTAGATDYDTITTKPGIFTVTATRVYAVGTEEVKSNKGNATNKIASNSTTLLENAPVSNKVNADKHIVSITKTASHTINYAYKIYATTGVAGELASQGLKTTVSNLAVTLKGGAAGQKFAVPDTYKNVKIEEFNATLNSWTDTTAGWTTSVTSYNLADGSSKNYTVFTRANNSGEDMKARISATVA